MTEYLDLIFGALGVNIQAALAAVATVIVAVAWLRQRGFTIPAFTLWKWHFTSGTATTLVVSLLVGGYAQYTALGFVFLAILGGGVLTYLAAAGIYDGFRAVLKS
jgi:hypothetical protein